VAEVDRTVDLVGCIGLGGDRCGVGWAFAGQRVTLRLDGSVMQVLHQQRGPLAALPCPLPPAVGCAESDRPGALPAIPPAARRVVAAHLDDGGSSRADVKQHPSPNRRASP
jgi:hypothetical protein